MKLMILNGWAASPQAWDLCCCAVGPGVRLYSDLEQLDGFPEKEIEESKEKVVVMGWSMGGAGALKLACRYPERIKGLVLVAATARMMEANNWKGMSERRLAAFETAVRQSKGEPLFGVPEGKPNPYRADKPTNLARGITFLRETDVRLQLIDLLASGKATFPVAVFQSEKDGIVRPENAKFLAAVFPQAEVTMVPGAEHALPIEIPEEIDAAVAAMM